MSPMPKVVFTNYHFNEELSDGLESLRENLMKKSEEKSIEITDKQLKEWEEFLIHQTPGGLNYQSARRTAAIQSIGMVAVQVIQALLPAYREQQKIVSELVEEVEYWKNRHANLSDSKTNEYHAGYKDGYDEAKHGGDGRYSLVKELREEIQELKEENEKHIDALKNITS
jgi:flagellar biosynthesis/type III secretory pathway protein FliH